MNNAFRKFAYRVSKIVGSPWSFVIALLLIVVWAVTGPMFHFSDTWQLVINTSTTIITFLMVFLIQNSQNRDSNAIQLKLDELIRAVTSARNNLVNLEELSDDELNRLHEEFRRLQETEKKESEKLEKKAAKLEKVESNQLKKLNPLEENRHDPYSITNLNHCCCSLWRDRSIAGGVYSGRMFDLCGSGFHWRLFGVVVSTPIGLTRIIYY